VSPSARCIFSASRDGTVRQWLLTSPNPPTYDDTIAVQATSFVNSLTYAAPSSAHSDGLLISAGKDTIIDVRRPFQSPDTDAERLLIGHANNVCSLDASADGDTLVSGGWDTQARVWSISKGECTAELKGHDAAVWAVMIYDDSTVITGCADKTIRVFSLGGKLLQTIPGLPDVVRTLCKLPSGHPSGAAFASAGNDQLVRLWTLGGVEVAQLHGHTSFIYALAVLSNGDLVSSGEDRTVRVWKGTECIQTITHPAISVWTVSACPETDDIITGASDKMIRVFSRDPSRHANADVCNPQRVDPLFSDQACRLCAHSTKALAHPRYRSRRRVKGSKSTRNNSRVRVRVQIYLAFSTASLTFQKNSYSKSQAQRKDKFK